MLQGLRYDVYLFVRQNPFCTRDDVAKGVGIRTSSATARIKELLDEGLLMEPGSVKENASGIKSRTLLLSDRPAGGSRLDKVRVEIQLTIDCNGVYGVTARVVRGKPQSGPTKNLTVKRITLTAPHPEVYAGMVSTDEIAAVNRMDTHAHADDIIDAEFVVLND
jgi:hypothetical protein